MPNGFILQLCFEHEPTGVEYRFSHACLSEGRTIDIADHDIGVALYDVGAEFVQRILALVCDFGVDRFDTLGMVRPLGNCELGFQSAVECSPFELPAIRASCRVLQSQINPDRTCAYRRGARDVDDDIEIPAPASVFSEGTGAKRIPAQSVAVEHAEEIAMEANLSVFPDCRPSFEWHPAQSALWPAGTTPLELVLFELAATLGMDSDNLLDGGTADGTQVAFGADTLQIVLQVEGGGAEGHPADLGHRYPGEHVGCFISCIPYLVDIERHLLQKRGVAVLDADPQSFGLHVHTAYDTMLFCPVNSWSAKMFKRGRHSVSSLTVHLVFVCKRRGKVFQNKHLDYLRDTFDGVLDSFESELLEFNGEEDHVHLLVSYPPKYSVSGLVNSLKGVSSRMLKTEFPEISDFWSIAKSKNSLWSPSYFAASTGGATIETLKRYIANQDAPLD